MQKYLIVISINKNSIFFVSYKLVSLGLTDSVLLQLANQKFCAIDDPTYKV